MRVFPYCLAAALVVVCLSSMGGAEPLRSNHEDERRADDESGDDCVDSNENCAVWASSGQCEANPGYMQKNCRMSCKECGEGGYHHTTPFIPGCHDNNGNCVDWAKFEQCEKNPDYMNVHCKESCGLCS